MGIFGRNAEQTKGQRAATELLRRPTAAPAVAISSPWAPQDSLITWAIDDALGGLLDRDSVSLTPEIALRIPAVKRGHGVICGQVAALPFFQMEGAYRTAEQADWLTNSASGVAPYHRMYGAANDWLFYGWACFGFNDDRTDCLHIPYGLWKIDEHGTLTADTDRIPAEYTAHLVAVPLGFGDNGLIADGADTIRQARNIEAAYQQRLDNPIALTVLSLANDKYEQYTREQRAALRDEWNEGRRKNATAMKPDWLTVETPGAATTDLFESGRNAVRLDLANHLALPASMLEGVRQGGSGGGTEMRYTGVSNGGTRSELWEFGLARRMVLAFEARMSLDDIVPPGHSIRADLTDMFTVPNANTNPTSED